MQQEAQEYISHLYSAIAHVFHAFSISYLIFLFLFYRKFFRFGAYFWYMQLCMGFAWKTSLLHECEYIYRTVGLSQKRNLEAKERVAFTRQRKHLLQQQQQQIIKEVKIKPFPTQLHKKQVMNRLQLPMQSFSAVFTFWKCQHHHTIFTAPFPQNSLFSTATTYWLCHILCTAEAPDLIQILRNNICLPVKSYGIFM